MKDTWDKSLYGGDEEESEPSKKEDEIVEETKLLSNLILNELKYKYDKPDPRVDSIMNKMISEGYIIDSGTIEILLDMVLKLEKRVDDLTQSVRFINGALNSME